MKFGQILVSCMTNISNMFMAQCMRQKTKFKAFYGFIKMAIKQDLAIFNTSHLPFLIIPCLRFQTYDLAKLKRTWNLVLVLQTVQKIPENYGPCLYLSVG